MAEVTKNVGVLDLRQFLIGIAPGTKEPIKDIALLGLDKIGRSAGHVLFPEISLYCDSDSCLGIRTYKTLQSVTIAEKEHADCFITYICKNCSGTYKTFALSILIAENLRDATVYKYGEDPTFGPPTPARFIKLIGPQRELFLKGRRAENQGLGIAAFAYYRRVIEGEKDRIFDEIIKVCERLAAGREVIADLVEAKKETSFARAVDSIKHGIPQALYINGHNPLTLLHGPLSESLQALSDAECLELATSVREVMAEFAERMGQALKDEAVLSSAVTRLLQKKPVNKDLVAP